MYSVTLSLMSSGHRPLRVLSFVISLGMREFIQGLWVNIIAPRRQNRRKARGNRIHFRLVARRRAKVNLDQWQTFSLDEAQNALLQSRDVVLTKWPGNPWRLFPPYNQWASRLSRRDVADVTVIFFVIQFSTALHLLYFIDKCISDSRMDVDDDDGWSNAAAPAVECARSYTT